MAKFPLLTLIVEDDFLVSYTLEKYLDKFELFDFNVVFTTKLKSTLHLLDITYFPLVLLDLKLDDSEGIETVRAIKAKCQANTAILPITGSYISKEELDDLGLEVYIQKPNLTSDLLREDIQIVLHNLALDSKTKDLLKELNTLCIHTNDLYRDKNII